MQTVAVVCVLYHPQHMRTSKPTLGSGVLVLIAILGVKSEIYN